jgi:hypothetical protein
MEWIEGDEDEAFQGYQQMVKQVSLDTSTEKLFLGRLYEGLANGNNEEGTDKDYNFYANAMYEEYPQLLPFSGIKVKMKLNTSGISDDITEEVVHEIKKCRVDWTEDADSNTPVAYVAFVKKGNKYEATVDVKSGSGMSTVSNEKMVFKDADGAGKELALRLFGKSGAMVFEKRDAGN